jgi:hypothetical protein
VHDFARMFSSSSSTFPSSSCSDALSAVPSWCFRLADLGVWSVARATLIGSALENAIMGSPASAFSTLSSFRPAAEAASALPVPEDSGYDAESVYLYSLKTKVGEGLLYPPRSFSLMSLRSFFHRDQKAGMRFVSGDPPRAGPW